MIRTILREKLWWVQRQMIIWGMVVVLCLAGIPLTTLAQDPLTVKSVKGNLLVNGQNAEEGTILSDGSVLETPAEGTATVEFSDGSRLEISERTRLSVVKTVETATATHIARLKIMQGWARVKAAKDIQNDGGLVFDVETPNAVIGAKLARANLEVGYEHAQQETVGIAHGVELRAENLLSGEERYIPQGSTVLIQAENMQVFEDTKRSKLSQNPVSGMFDKLSNTKTLLLVGGLVGATAVTAALIESEEDVTEDDFVGNFERTDTAEGGDVIHERISIQAGSITALSGFYQVTRSGPNCQYEYTRDFTGRVSSYTGFLTLAPLTYTQQCQSGSADITLSTETWTCKLRNEKAVLRCTNRDGNEVDYQRQ